MAYTLVIDQGTHASRAILFDQQGGTVEQRQQDISLNRLDTQRVEQDANEILQSVKSVIAQLDKKHLRLAQRCAITTQRSTLVAWHRPSGKPLYPAISWQDRRGHQALQTLADQQQTIRQLTGLPLSAHYGASKMRWLLHHVEAVQQAQQAGELCLAPLSSFLLQQLLSEQPYQVDHSNAHRTLLFDIRTLDWSAELARLFQVPEALLPGCRPLLHDYGRLAGYGIPVTAMCGDQTAALNAHGRLPADAALINMGSGAFVLSSIAQPVTDSRLLCSIAYSDAQHCGYALEGTVNGAGAALSWAQQQFPVDDLYAQLPGWLQQPEDSGQHPPPLFINSVGGLGSPWWKAEVAPHFIHDQNSSTADRYRAIIDSIAFLLMNNIEAIQQVSVLTKLYVSGGLSRLDGLCQRLADLSDLPVHRLAETEATARGAAWLANHCPAHWPGPVPDKTFLASSAPQLVQRYGEFTARLNGL